MRDNGNGKGLLHRAARVVKNRLPRVRSFIFSSGPPNPSLAGAMARKGIEMVEFNAVNIERTLEFRNDGIVGNLKHYMEMGAKGWFAEKDQEILGYVFLMPVTNKPRLVRRFRLYPGEAGAIFFYTRPEFRDRGLGAALGKEAIARADDIESVERVVAWTAPHNCRWIRPFERWGLTFQGRVWIFECFGRTLFRFTRGSLLKR